MAVAKMLQRARVLLEMAAAGDKASEAVLLNQGRILSALLGSRQGRGLQEHEFRVFSQWGEDGIIQHLVREVSIKHQTFIEFGVEDFREANCRFLMMNNNWSGFVLDGSHDNVERMTRRAGFWRYDLRGRGAFITPKNINELLSESGFDPDLGILSVDIDGMDYWVLSAIEGFSPRVLIVEYNALFGAERAISVPLDPQFERQKAHFSMLYFGASLPAFHHWGVKNGYSLVGTASNGANAFFIRNDVLPTSLPPLSPVEAFTESRFREARDETGGLTFARGSERIAAIRGMPVVNVTTSEMEVL